MCQVIVILLGLILVGGIIGLTTHFVYFWFQLPDIASLVEDKKCPACYGIDLCPDFYSGQFKFDDDFASAVQSYVNAKNVYEGNHPKYGGKAVMKKLAHDFELKNLDKKVCNLFGPTEESCDFGDLTKIDLWDDIYRMLEANQAKSTAENTRLTVCPSTEGIREILRPFFGNDTSGEKVLLANVWTMLNVNPEPIILKYLNSDSPLWPVPTYYGACGRATLQQYGGRMLSSYLSRPWLYRAEIAIKLINMANIFTFNHTRFRFYLSDISSDNIVLKDEGLYANDPMFVDMEHVIVVDTQSQAVADTWKANHTSQVIECEGCFAFSARDVCDHHLSDHNVYSMCKLLEEEVLDSVPDFVTQRFPSLPQKLSDCVSPKQHADRFTAAAALKQELIEILKMFALIRPENSPDAL